MASEYSLNLKAKLDTSQVKQEIAQIRQQIQTQVGGVNNATGKATGINRRADDINIKLTQQMTRLTQSIQQLQRSMDVLAKANSQFARTGLTSSTQANVSGRMPFAMSPGQQAQKAVSSYQDDLAKSFLKKFNQTVQDLRSSGVKYNSSEFQQKMGRFDRLLGWKDDPRTAGRPVLTDNMTAEGRAVQNMFGGNASSADIGRFIRSQAGREFLNSTGRSNPIGGSHGKTMFKAGATWLASDIAGSAADYLDASGHKKAAAALGFAGTVGQYTASGAMIGMWGGPKGAGIGAGIGLAVGVIKGAFDSAANSIREFDKAIKSLKESVLSGKKFDWGVEDYRRSRRIKSATKNKDIETLQHERDAVDFLSEQIDPKIRLIDGQGGLENYNRMTKQLKEAGVDDKEIEERIDAANEYQLYKAQSMNLGKTSDEISDQIEKIQEKLLEDCKAITRTIQEINTEEYIESFEKMTNESLKEVLVEEKKALDKLKSERLATIVDASTNGLGDEKNNKKIEEANRQVGIKNSVVDALKRRIQFTSGLQQQSEINKTIEGYQGLSGRSISDLLEARKGDLYSAKNERDALVKGGKFTEEELQDADNKIKGLQALVNALESIDEVGKRLEEQAKDTLNGFQNRARYNKEFANLNEENGVMDLGGPGAQFEFLKTNIDRLRNEQAGYEKTAIEQSQRARDESLSMQDRQNAQDSANSALEKSGNVSGILQMYESALRSINTNKQTDLTNVTSLAKMGFGMGENNDNIQRQEANWKESINLQRDIKRILNDKSWQPAYQE